MSNEASTVVPPRPGAHVESVVSRWFLPTIFIFGVLPIFCMLLSMVGADSKRQIWRWQAAGALELVAPLPLPMNRVHCAAPEVERVACVVSFVSDSGLANVSVALPSREEGQAFEHAFVYELAALRTPGFLPQVEMGARTTLTTSASENSISEGVATLVHRIEAAREAALQELGPSFGQAREAWLRKRISPV